MITFREARQRCALNSCYLKQRGLLFVVTHYYRKAKGKPLSAETEDLLDAVIVASRINRAEPTTGGQHG